MWCRVLARLTAGCWRLALRLCCRRAGSAGWVLRLAVVAAPGVALMLRDEKERVMRGRQVKLVGVVLLAVLASSVVVESAQGEIAPSFTIGGTRLVAGRTHNGDARAVKTFILTNPLGTVKLECTSLGTEEGVSLGSNAENPGKGDGIEVFSGCVNPAGSNGENCHLSNKEEGAETVTTLKTEPLKGEEVENVVNGTKGNQLLGEIFPAKGSVFITLFYGGQCTIFASKVSGQVVGEVVLDNSSEGKVELGQAPQERTSWLLRFPNPPITQVWLISNGVGKIVKTEETGPGGQTIQEGTALGLLASTKFVPEPNALWSPLP
jgi:hypothetical protein